MQRGNSKHRSPAGKPVAGGAKKSNLFSGLRAKRRRRKEALKRRLAKMPRRRRYTRRVGVIGTWLLGACAVLLIAAIGAFYTLTNVPSPQDLSSPQSGLILYSDGSVLARIGYQNTINRTDVSIDQVPEQVRWDILAAEDRNFYNEPGVSIKGTLRALLTDLTGGDTQGGSTITQQYVKNAYLNDSRTLSRKLKELAIAVKLDRQYSKNQILEYYLNTVYFGRGAYGIQAAAQTYFGVDVSKLTVAQGAVLASLLRSPSYYDPANNPGAAQARWNYVIDGMVSVKQLTQQQADALKYPKVLPDVGNRLGATGPNAFIVTKVIAELAANGISEDEIYARGLTIKTTIDKTAQAAAVSAVNTTFANLTSQQKNLKNALVAVNPADGAVLAYYGGPNGVGYDKKPDYYDYAGVGSRPPGSSFKPYTLATALTDTLNDTPNKPHYTINSRVDGSFTVTIAGTKIQNDPGDFSVSGPSVSVANAMKYSLNTTFDQMAEAVGPADVAATAHAAGIAETDSAGNKTLQEPDGTTSFGIGIGDYPVRPLDQAVGYATFANNGVQNDAYFVAQATTANGKLVYTHRAQPKQALDSRVANDVTLTLEPIAAWSNDPLSGGRVSAAKTGTVGIMGATNNNSDAWMVGYTPQVSTAVWTGSGDSTEPIYNSAGAAEYGSDLPGKTWALFMDTYLTGKPNLPMATTQQVGASPVVASTPSNQSPTPTASKSTTSPAKTTVSPSAPAPSRTLKPHSSSPVTSTPATPTGSPTSATSSTSTASPTPTPARPTSIRGVGAG